MLMYCMEIVSPAFARENRASAPLPSRTTEWNASHAVMFAIARAQYLRPSMLLDAHEMKSARCGIAPSWTIWNRVGASVVKFAL